MVNYKINVYLKHTEMENMYVREFIELVTQDINGNNFEFTVYEDDNVYDLTNKRVTMIVKSDSGTVIQENCQVVDAKQGKATITLPPDMLIENGPYMAEVQIWEGVNSRVTTLPFDYTVRLSLENDESIKADPRFSLLQVALQNVNDADGKSKEALKLSKEAKAICDDLVPKANTAAQNAQEALDRAESVVTQEELAQKVTLDGNDTKFDFTGSKVEQRGMTFSKEGIIRATVTQTFADLKEFSTSFKFNTGNFINGWLLTLGNGLGINLRTDGWVHFRKASDNTLIYGIPNLNWNKNTDYIYTLIQNGKSISLYVNGTPYVVNMYFDVLTETSTQVSYKFAEDLIGESVYVYENILTPQEIQHNFSVLNNSPSISQLHTTDSTGKTSILKLGSDEDHVEMASGRTLREEYMGVLKAMGKEVPSADGSPIQVPNGIEARVINAEIKGQTVKNIAKTKNDFITAKGDGTIKAIHLVDDIGLVQPNTEYTIITEVILNTLDGQMQICNQNIVNMMNPSDVKVPAGKTGVFKADVTSKSDLNGAKQIIRQALSTDSTTGSITFRTCVVERKYSKLVNGFIPFGLSSTEAIVSNNGEKYPIYEPTIQGKTRILDADTGLVPTDPTLPALKDGDVLDLATRTITFANKTTRVLTDEEVKAYSAFKKVISLGGLGDTKDTLEILEDGSGIWLNRLARVVLNGSENWSIGNTGTQNYYYQCTLPFGTQSGGVSDKYSFAAIGQSDINQGFYITGNSLVRVRYGTEKPLNDFKQDLSTNNLTIICILATPIITHIPKEIVSAILTHNQTNILEVGGAVKPSSFKVTVPVDKLAEIEARLQALESTTVDVVLNK